MARVDPFIVGFLTIWEIFRDLVVHASDCYFKGAYMYVPILALSKIPRGDKAKSMYPLHKQTIVYCLGSVGRMPHVFHRCKGVARRFCGSLWYKISSTVVVFASTFLVCLAATQRVKLRDNYMETSLVLLTTISFLPPVIGGEHPLQLRLCIINRPGSHALHIHSYTCMHVQHVLSVCVSQGSMWREISRSVQTQSHMKH